MQEGNLIISAVAICKVQYQILVLGCTKSWATNLFLQFIISCNLLLPKPHFSWNIWSQKLTLTLEKYLIFGWLCAYMHIHTCTQITCNYRIQACPLWVARTRDFQSGKKASQFCNCKRTYQEISNNRKVFSNVLAALYLVIDIKC